MTHQLYALLDKTTLEKYCHSLEWLIEKAVGLGAVLLQYRNKSGTLEEKKEDILRIKKLCDTPLIIDDDVELVKFCEGVHLGQEDIMSFDEDIKKAAKIVREVVGKKLFGLSTHNKYEIKIANTLPVDYIGLGAFRKTDTKSGVTILGGELDILAKLSIKPVAAIGGVRLDDKFQNVKYLVVGSNLYEN